jgi:hypothetical protein
VKNNILIREMRERARVRICIKTAREGLAEWLKW